MPYVYAVFKKKFMNPDTTTELGGSYSTLFSSGFQNAKKFMFFVKFFT